MKLMRKACTACVLLPLLACADSADIGSQTDNESAVDAPPVRIADDAASERDAARPDAARPDAARPDVARPDTARPDAAEVDATVPTRASFGTVAAEPTEYDGTLGSLEFQPQLSETLDEVRRALPSLAGQGMKVGLTVQAHRLADATKREELFALLSEAQRAGVEIHPVPVLSADQGYYPNAVTAEPFAAVVRDLVAQWAAHGLKPTLVLIDMEPPHGLVQAIGSANLFTAAPGLYMNRERFDKGKLIYEQLVDELHAAGWRVGITTIGALVTDYDDGDDDMRQYFNVVLDGPAWDEIDLQLYRSIYLPQFPTLDGHWVYAYVQQGKALFPNASVGASIGLSHAGAPYPDAVLYAPEEFRKDVAAALAANVERARIGLYSLGGIDVADPADPWLQPVQAATPAANEATEAFRAMNVAFDKLLDDAPFLF